MEPEQELVGMLDNYAPAGYKSAIMLRKVSMENKRSYNGGNGLGRLISRRICATKE
jgi:hypothetical protein